MVVNHHLNVTHNLGVPPVRLLGHLDDAGIIAKYACWLGIEHKRHSKQALDPFWQNKALALGQIRVIAWHPIKGVPK